MIREFPDNPVVVLPQSVHYDDAENLRRDAAFLKDYPNVVICLRDKHSFEILSDVVPNRLLLVPDMAFFVDARKYADEVEEGDGTLYLRRVDKEAPPGCVKKFRLMQMCMTGRRLSGGRRSFTMDCDGN